MADNADMGQAAQAAAEAAAVTTGAIEAVKEDAEAAIERAEERAENAAELAQQLTDAALASEIGKRVTACEEMVGSWQTRMTELAARVEALTALEQTTLTIQAALAELKSASQSAPTTVLIQPRPSQEPEATPGASVDPTEAGSADHIGSEPPSSERKRTKRFV